MCKDAPSLTRRISSSTCKRRSRRTPYQALVKIETVAARASHQETLIQTNKEVEELRKVRCSAADLREEAFLQKRQSTVNQLTHQLQEVVNSLSESQDFKDFETACSSGSANAPGKPFVFSEFSTLQEQTSEQTSAAQIQAIPQQRFCQKLAHSGAFTAYGRGKSTKLHGQAAEVQRPGIAV